MLSNASDPCEPVKVFAFFVFTSKALTNFFLICLFQVIDSEQIVLFV